MGEARQAGDTGAATVAAPWAEPRWPMAVAVLVAILLQVGTPHRGRLPGWWVFPVLESVLLVVVILRDPGADRPSEPRGETIHDRADLAHDDRHDGRGRRADGRHPGGVRGISATDLLGRGAAVWFTNVIVFSLWYWELDRGGPAERAADSGAPPSFAFPENAMPEFAETGWRPRYPDYLYLAFTNATAFSPTDTLPVKTWAKMTMLLQSAVSLVTAILVIARAINDL